MMRIVCMWLLLQAAACCCAKGQNIIGIPNIINYTKEQYSQGSQNWNIAQDSNGITYFANDNGLLSFDGTFWRIYTLPNHTIARSLAIDRNNRIYIGGQGEIGYFSPGKNGDLTYTSLTALIPAKDNDFTDVWNTILFDNAVFFRSHKKIFRYANNKLTVYNNSLNWSFMGKAGNRLIAFRQEYGLVTYEKGNWQPFVPASQFPAGIQVTAVLPAANDTLLLTSLTNGVYHIAAHKATRFETPLFNRLSSANIYGAQLLDSNTIAIITNLAGCFLATAKGEFVQQFSKSEGLQKNNILCLYQDKNKNLWLGLDNGIDLVTYNNAITEIFPDGKDRNAGYTSLLYHNRLYIGTSTGLYTTPLDSSRDLSYVKNNFEFVPRTTGQVWNLSVVNGKLLMGHNKGAFVINNLTASAVDVSTGFWTFLPLYPTSPSPVMIAGTYNGINFYNDSANTFSNPGIHEHFESARYVVKSGNSIWIAHPYKGLYKVGFDKKGNAFSTVYKDDNHILSDNHNHLFSLKNRMVLTNQNGIFEYSPPQQDFVPSAYFQKLFGKLPVSYLQEDRYGNIWFCMDKKPGVIDVSTGTPQLRYFPELNNRILADDYESIYVADSNNVFVSGEKGIFHINYSEYKKKERPLSVLIRSVRTFKRGDSLLYGGYDSHNSEPPSVAYADNSLHFEFSAVVYDQPQTIEYSYYLEGFENTWLDWTTKAEKDYTNLPAGDYTFKVKSRNSSNHESGIALYRFSILPPWYQTGWAYLVYVLMLAAIVVMVDKRQVARLKRRQQRDLEQQQQKYEEEQRQLQYQHQLQIEKNEREIVQLKNEKLQAEIEQEKREEEQKRLQLLHQIEAEKKERELVALRNEKLNIEIKNKNAELASTAMILVQKGELLSKIKEELTKLKKNAEPEQESKDFKRVIKIIDSELDSDHEWEQFAVHFDSVHTGYLKRIKELHPDLTPTELKLCAYLRLNLSTKEIAQLMNISARGVETSRYRLRRKLNITGETSLFDFLMQVK